MSSSSSSSTVPGNPTNVIGSAGNKQVNLSWTAPASSGGATIADYVIQYSSNSGSTWTTFDHVASALTSSQVTGLLNGVGYIFRVAAVSSVGTGGYSIPSALITPVSISHSSFGTVVINDRSDFSDGKVETSSYAVRVTQRDVKYSMYGGVYATDSKVQYDREYKRILGSRGVMASVKSFVSQFSGCPEAHKLRKRMIALSRIRQTISGEEFRFPTGCE